MQNLPRTLEQDLLPEIEWESPSAPSCQQQGKHVAKRIRDVAPPEWLALPASSTEIPSAAVSRQSADINAYFVTDRVTDASHIHSSQILFVTIGKRMHCGRSRHWVHERAAAWLTSMGTCYCVKNFLESWLIIQGRDDGIAREKLGSNVTSMENRQQIAR